jgi:hypothetical protein
MDLDLELRSVSKATHHPILLAQGDDVSLAGIEIISGPLVPINEKEESDPLITEIALYDILNVGGEPPEL